MSSYTSLTLGEGAEVDYEDGYMLGSATSSTHFGSDSYFDSTYDDRKYYVSSSAWSFADLLGKFLLLTISEALSF